MQMDRYKIIYLMLTTSGKSLDNKRGGRWGGGGGLGGLTKPEQHFLRLYQQYLLLEILRHANQPSKRHLAEEKSLKCCISFKRLRHWSLA